VNRSQKAEVIERGYVSFAVDDAGSPRDISQGIPDHARLVGWQCGFEPLYVAVWSYLPGVTLDDEEAMELATDYLVERKWFSGEPTHADYVL
jgi:hypothetical protein